MRSGNDPRLSWYLEKLGDDEKEMQVAIQPRQIREPKFVRGYMQDDW
jgi:hypothetical protein